MKKLKKILSITICLVFTFVLFTTTVSAEENKQTTQTTITSEKTAYIDSILKEYLLLEKHTPSDDYYISNSYQINYFNSNTVDNATEIYFVFKDNDVIGMLNVGYNNNEYTSKYSRISNDVVSTLFAEKTPFALGYVSDDLYVYYNNQLVPLLNNATTDIDMSVKSISTKSVIKERNYSFTQIRSSALFNKVLNVTHVDNALNPYTGDGLCWAACVAMKANYQNNYSSPLIAVGVLQLLRSKYESRYGMPVGTMVWVQRAYDYFNINSNGSMSGLTASQVSSIINNNKPIQIHLQGNLVSNGTSVSHAVLIIGCTIFSDHAIYIIDDPNLPERQYQSVSSTAMTNPNAFLYYAPMLDDETGEVDDDTFHATYHTWTQTCY